MPLLPVAGIPCRMGKPIAPDVHRADAGEVESTYPSPEARFYDAASRWYPEPHWDAKALIDAAVQGLVDGLDSPSLRMLAGASPADRREDIHALLQATLDERDRPRPGEGSPGKQVAA